LPVFFGPRAPLWRWGAFGPPCWLASTPLSYGRHSESTTGPGLARVSFCLVLFVFWSCCPFFFRRCSVRPLRLLLAPGSPCLGFPLACPGFPGSGLPFLALALWSWVSLAPAGPPGLPAPSLLGFCVFPSSFLHCGHRPGCGFRHCALWSPYQQCKNIVVSVWPNFPCICF
jgi:hypothetical protein